MTTKKDEIAQAILGAFTSPDSGLGMKWANIVDAAGRMVLAIDRVADAEALGKAILTAANRVADALDNLADAIREGRKQGGQ